MRRNQVKTFLTQISILTITKTRDKAINAKLKWRFLIERELLNAVLDQRRGIIKCVVERYERKTDLTIQN